MIEIRPSEERGRNKLSWLDTPLHIFVRPVLRPGARAVPLAARHQRGRRRARPAVSRLHPHRDMEILTWILDGALEHRDSTGGSGVIRPGELQHMTRGQRRDAQRVQSVSRTTRFICLQIWIAARAPRPRPGYEQLCVSRCRAARQVSAGRGTESSRSRFARTRISISRASTRARYETRVRRGSPCMGAGRARHGSREWHRVEGRRRRSHLERNRNCVWKRKTTPKFCCSIWPKRLRCRSLDERAEVERIPSNNEGLKEE